jgi:hypothetical protein
MCLSLLCIQTKAQAPDI